MAVRRGGLLPMVAIVAVLTIGYGGHASDHTRDFKSDISGGPSGGDPWRARVLLRVGGESPGPLVASKLAADQPAPAPTT